MIGEMSFGTCYAKLNFDVPYVRTLSLRRDSYSVCFTEKLCDPMVNNPMVVAKNDNFFLF